MSVSEGGPDDRRRSVLVDAVGLVDLDLTEPGGAELALKVRPGQGAGDAAGPLLHVVPSGLVHVGIGDDIADREASAAAQHARRLAEHGRLVFGQVDHAVADDHVDRVVGQWRRLDRALDELDILHTGLGLVSPRQLEHLVGHVQAVGLAGGADAAGREQHVDATPGPEVENRLALMQIGDCGRVAAAERSQVGRVGQRLTIGVVVETGAERLALLVGDHGGVAAAARSAPAGGGRGGRVPLAYALADVLLTGAAAAGPGVVLGPATLPLGLGLTAGFLCGRRATAPVRALLAGGQPSHLLTSCSPSGLT